MPPEKSTTYKCRRGLPQQGMWGVISLTINDLNRLSSSDLPYRQLRNVRADPPSRGDGDLPYRQLRKLADGGGFSWPRDLPYRQLRNAAGGAEASGIGDLPYRQLRKLHDRGEIACKRDLPYRQLRKGRPSEPD